ncbi:MAG TPA: hypothetical protein VHN14_10055 [Kofleriaceae bacterium]|jgi:hypothetical protein|nr:hypothetical protein [Kofleriaceae bacterium]
MQHILRLLAILPLACASSATAAPDTATKPAPAPHGDACRPGGGVLFEIDHRVDPGAKLATSATKVFTSGAWTHDATDGDGKAAAQRAGCITKPDLKQLEAALHGAPWKVNVSRVHCMAVTAQFTVFQVDGKPVFTQRLCSGTSLDDKSQAALDAATKLVEGEVGKTPP